MEKSINMLINSNEFTHDDYEIIERDVVYSGLFKLVRYHLRNRLFNGNWSEPYVREVLERYSAAAVLPYDPIQDRVILIEQFRPGSIANPKNPWLIEIPAGIITNNESPEAIAHSEAEEEAGCIVTELYPICEFFVSPGGSNEYLNIYCGKTDATHVEGVHGLDYEHEDIHVLNLTFEQAIKLLQQGAIKTSPATTALLWLQLNREKMRDLWR